MRLSDINKDCLEVTVPLCRKNRIITKIKVRKKSRSTRKKTSNISNLVDMLSFEQAEKMLNDILKRE